jgi:hypothetical protein
VDHVIDPGVPVSLDLDPETGPESPGPVVIGKPVLRPLILGTIVSFRSPVSLLIQISTLINLAFSWGGRRPAKPKLCTRERRFPRLRQGGRGGGGKPATILGFRV